MAEGRAGPGTAGLYRAEHEAAAAVEEERMARDIYLAAAAKWKLPVFTQIAQSESRHEAVLVRLAATAGVALPAAQAGIYATGELRQLHAALMALVEDRERAMAVREKALFWLAQSGSEQAFRYLDLLLSAG